MARTRSHGWRAAWGLVAAAAVLIPVAPAQSARRSHVRLRHHGDPARALRPVSGARAITPLPTTWCGVEQTTDVSSPLSNAPQVKVIYAYGSGGTDNFSTYKDKIQSDVDAIRQRLDTESGGTRSIRFDLGNVAPGGGCSGHLAKEYADIQTVQLPKTAAQYNASPSTLFTTLKTDVLAAVGPTAPGARTDFVVYADLINKGGAIAGEADSAIDDSHGYGNATNHGPNGDGRLVAIIYGFGGAEFNGSTAGGRQASFLHELTHTQGAVQNSAPHASRAGHCYDEQDIMCYNDGGPYFTGGGLVQTPCATGTANDFTEPYDCNKDDYFNAAPAAGSYLATHWNVYDSVFMCAVASCDSTIAPPAVSLNAPSSAFRGATMSLTATVTGATVEHYEWDLDNDGRFELDTGTTNSTSQQLTANGTKTVRVRATTTDGTFGSDAKSITVTEPQTPSPSFTISSGTPVVNRPVTFDASATTDPSGVITNYRWDLDGNGTFEFDGGLTKTATTTFTTAGTHLVTLEVDYPTGLGQISAQVNVGTGATTQPVTIGPTMKATRVRLAKLLRSGLPLTVTCGAACSATAKLTVSAKVAKQLHLRGRKGKPVTIGSLKRSVPSAGTLKTAIALTSAARRALMKARSVTVTLAARLTQTGFQPLVLSRRLAIRR